MTTIAGRDFIADMLAEDPEPATAPTGTDQISFEIKRWVLAALLEKAAGAIPTRDVMPVLKCFQIEARPGRLRVVASDLDLSVIATTEIVTVTGAGTAVIPARKLLDILRAADGEMVTVRIRGGLASITIGRTAWSLKLPSGADYPPMPEITDVAFVTIERTAFLAALHAVRYAVCRDIKRSNLRLVDVRGGRMIGCDGARFQQATIAGLSLDVRITVDAVDDLLKLLKTSDLPEIAIGCAEDHLIFRLGADLLIANKFTAVVPDMQAQFLRPALTNKQPLTVDRATLLDAIKRVRINADTETSAIALSLAPGSLTITTRDKYDNDSSETIDAEWAGPARTIAVNHAFLTDMISMHAKPVCTFLLGEDTRTRKAPVMLRDDEAGTVGVVQQMHADWVGVAT